jgi:C_GCAxxG_C_C family probable redox protein
MKMPVNKQLIEEARQRGRDYLVMYHGCAQATLLAVTDTLQMPVSDEVFKVMIGLSSPSGGCGGICGAIAAIGLRFGRSRDDYRENPETVLLRQTVKRVRDQFVTKYGGYLCCDIQTHLFGRSYDALDPVEREAFMQRQLYDVCPQVTEDAAGWTVEAILEAEASSS